MARSQYGARKIPEYSEEPYTGPTYIDVMVGIRNTHRGASRKFKGINRALLEALALRCNPRRDGGQFLCWSSYARIAKDTGYSEKRLRESARVLEEQQLIRRGFRVDQSNIFQINHLAIINQGTYPLGWFGDEDWWKNPDNSEAGIARKVAQDKWTTEWKPPEE